MNFGHTSFIRKYCIMVYYKYLVIGLEVIDVVASPATDINSQCHYSYFLKKKNYHSASVSLQDSLRSHLRHHVEIELEIAESRKNTALAVLQLQHPVVANTNTGEVCTGVNT